VSAQARKTRGARREKNEQFRRSGQVWEDAERERAPRRKVRGASNVPAGAAGLVVRSERGWWEVLLPGDARVGCVLRGRLRGVVQPVIGDEVRVRVTSGDAGFIEEVLPRRSSLTRRVGGGREHVLAANVDQVVLTVSTRTPAFRAGAVERLLAYAYEAELTPVLALTKTDLVTREEAEELLRPWAALPFTRLSVSTQSGAGLADLREVLRDRVSVLVGPSGAGKSSLVNALQPNANARTGAVSDWNAKGQHTTTSSRLFPLSFGGFLVDTPGVKELGLGGVSGDVLARSFADVLALAARCAYRGCRHGSEPGCAVRAAVHDGALPRERFVQFERLKQELEA